MLFHWVDVRIWIGVTRSPDELWSSPKMIELFGPSFRTGQLSILVSVCPPLPGGFHSTSGHHGGTWWSMSKDDPVCLVEVCMSIWSRMYSLVVWSTSRTILDPLSKYRSIRSKVRSEWKSFCPSMHFQVISPHLSTIIEVFDPVQPWIKLKMVKIWLRWSMCILWSDFMSWHSPTPIESFGPQLCALLRHF